MTGLTCRLVTMVTVCVALTACGGSPSPKGGGDEDIRFQDVGGDSDLSTLDLAGNKDGRHSDSHPESQFGMDSEGADTSADFSVTRLCESERGSYCPCVNGADCNSGWCIETTEGRLCAAICEEDCPTGWDCLMASSRPDLVSICVPRHTWLCRPCFVSSDCYPGGPDTGARCIPLDDQAGAYCGGRCDSSASCPSGYGCVDTTSVEGIQTLQCQPKSGRCACNDRFALAGAATWCRRINDHGTCEGTWNCTASTMTDCSARQPSLETCNGVDDNCDGLTDEGTTGVSCDITNDHGTCPGIQTCTNGTPLCEGTPPKAETCNGVDDNCDGITDNGFPDMDLDGTADCVDSDIDGDGIPNEFDCEPMNPVVPSCAGKVCGEDGCGISCGECLPGFGCQSGQCVCMPNCQGKICGPDGCGNSCGDCLPGYGCQGGQCVCIPNCGDKICGNNGCGGSCGDCLPGFGCQGGQCVCAPNCAGKDCGDNGCGGSCGSCPGGFLCQSGVCTCAPKCAGKECGPDGCGGTGTCGTCTGGLECSSEGKCVLPNPCGTLTWGGECDDIFLRYCHQAGNANAPCSNPPNCQVREVNCFLVCMFSLGMGTCVCTGSDCDCLCITPQ